MARTILIWAPTGLASPTCKLMAESALLTVVETITLTEHATVKRAYTGTITAGAATYRYNLLAAGLYIGGGSVEIEATDGVTYEADQSGDVIVSVSAAAVAMQVVAVGGRITIHRGDYTSFQLTGLGSLVGRSGAKLFFTVKTSRDSDLTDAAAILQITETTGAVRVNGATYATASDGSITVNDAATGAITIAVQSALTKLLSPATGLYYDVQLIRADGQAATLTRGFVDIEADVTRRQSL